LARYLMRDTRTVEVMSKAIGDARSRGSGLFLIRETTPSQTSMERVIASSNDNGNSLCMSNLGTNISGRAFAMVCDQRKSNVIVGEIMNDGGTTSKAAKRQRRHTHNRQSSASTKPYPFPFP
jgi:hypothetical protein